MADRYSPAPRSRRGCLLSKVHRSGYHLKRFLDGHRISILTQMQPRSFPRDSSSTICRSRLDSPNGNHFASISQNVSCCVGIGWREELVDDLTARYGYRLRTSVCPFRAFHINISYTRLTYARLIYSADDLNTSSCKSPYELSFERFLHHR